jgi:hypothetical protein
MSLDQTTRRPYGDLTAGWPAVAIPQRTTMHLPFVRRALARVVLVLAVAPCLLAVSCGGEDTGGPLPAGTTAAPPRPPTTSASASSDPAGTTSTPPPTTDRAAEEAAILAAYQGYWDTWLAANNPPDPNHPDLERYATGEALRSVRSTIAGHRSMDIALRAADKSEARHLPRVQSVSGGAASVLDCALDDGVTFRWSSGEVLEDSVYTYALRAEMTEEEGVWRVAHVFKTDQWLGRHECFDKSSDS